MKKLRFLFVGIFIVIALCLTLVACDNNTNTDNESNNNTTDNVQPEPTSSLEFELDKNGLSYSVVGIGDYTDTDLIIPFEYNGKPVKGIVVGAFAGCITLTSVTIPDSITYIAISAFSGCTSIQEATMPAGAIDSIPKGVLKKVVITSGVAIGELAFYNCKTLTDITICESVTTISESAFEYCDNIKMATIYAGIIFDIPRTH